MLSTIAAIEIHYSTILRQLCYMYNSTMSHSSNTMPFRKEVLLSYNQVAVLQHKCLLPQLSLQKELSSSSKIVTRKNEPIILNDAPCICSRLLCWRNVDILTAHKDWSIFIM